MSSRRTDLDQFPGGEPISQGLLDLNNGHRTEAALAVLVASPRLRSLGFAVPELAQMPAICEHALYELIEDRRPLGAHAAYNAIIQLLVSFANAYASKA